MHRVYPRLIYHTDSQTKKSRVSSNPAIKRRKCTFVLEKQHKHIASTQSPLSIAMFGKYGMWQIVAGFHVLLYCTSNMQKHNNHSVRNN